VPNVLAAVAVGKHFKVPDDKIKSALENYLPSNSRSQLIKKGTNKIILDAYNANPSSMKLAIENFSKLNAENKVLILGGMAELGAESMEEHNALIKLIQKYNWKAVALVGGDFLKINHPFLSFENNTEAKDWIQKQHFENTHLLVKGSRSIKLEKILEA
ncbi:MAG: cyanophycin synthetase, partial [Chitinophagaceae bacterium]